VAAAPSDPAVASRLIPFDDDAAADDVLGSF
jgi:hypothetical protein